MHPPGNHASPQQPHMPSLATTHAPRQPHMSPWQPCMPPGNNILPGNHAHPPGNHTCPLATMHTPPWQPRTQPRQPCMPPGNHAHTPGNHACPLATTHAPCQPHTPTPLTTTHNPPATMHSPYIQLIYIFTVETHYYCLLMKFVKVMFLQVSVCPQRGGMPGCSGGVCGCSGGCAWFFLGGWGHASDTTRYGQWAGGTHPTQMHSCFLN